MDDESGESMEPMEEVPPKEPGEKESGASRGHSQNLSGEATNVA